MEKDFYIYYYHNLLRNSSFFQYHTVTATSYQMEVLSDSTTPNVLTLDLSAINNENVDSTNQKNYRRPTKRRRASHSIIQCQYNPSPKSSKFSLSVPREPLAIQSAKSLKPNRPKRKSKSSTKHKRSKSARSRVPSKLKIDDNEHYEVNELNGSSPTKRTQSASPRNMENDQFLIKRLRSDAQKYRKERDTERAEKKRLNTKNEDLKWRNNVLSKEQQETQKEVIYTDTHCVTHSLSLFVIDH